MITDYSGHTEFCKEENSMGVKITEMDARYQWSQLNHGVNRQRA